MRRRFAELADQVLAALAGRIFVAHNARFDWDFVSAELRRARDLALDGPRLCTVRLARRLVQGHPLLRARQPDAATSASRTAARHRAAGDALVTAELLARLLRAGPRGRGRGRCRTSRRSTLRRVAGRGRRKRLAIPTEPRADSCPEG